MLTCLLVCPHDSYVAAVEVEVVLGTDCYLSASPAVPVQPAGWEHKVKIKRPWLALAHWRTAARPAGRW